MEAVLVNPLARAAIMLYADPLGVHQPQRVNMKFECRTGELLARAEFMYHDDQGLLPLKG